MVLNFVWQKYEVLKWNVMTNHSYNLWPNLLIL